MIALYIVITAIYCGNALGALRVLSNPQVLPHPITTTSSVNEYGTALSIDENDEWLAIGAPTSACNFDLNSVGCVFVYRRASNGTWLYQHMLGAYDSIYEKNPLLPRVPLLADPAVRTQFILTNANAFFGDAYGLSLKLRGDFLIVGAPEDANFTLPETIFTNTTPAGSFHIFRRNNNADVSRNTSWIRESKVYLFKEDQDDYQHALGSFHQQRNDKSHPGLGYTVDIINFGGTWFAAAGTEAWDGATGVDTGPLYISVRDNASGSWRLLQRWFPPSSGFTGFATSIRFDTVTNPQGQQELGLFIFAQTNKNRFGAINPAEPLALYLATFNPVTNLFEIRTTARIQGGNGPLTPSSFTLRPNCAQARPDSSYVMQFAGGQLYIHSAACTHADGMCTFLLESTLRRAAPLTGLGEVVRITPADACPGVAASLSPSLDLAVTTASNEQGPGLTKGFVYVFPANARPAPASGLVDAAYGLGDVGTITGPPGISDLTYPVANVVRLTTDGARCLGENAGGLVVTRTQIIVADPCYDTGKGALLVWSYTWTEDPAAPPNAAGNATGPATRLEYDLALSPASLGDAFQFQQRILAVVQKTVEEGSGFRGIVRQRVIVSATPTLVVARVTQDFPTQSEAESFSERLRLRPQEIFVWERSWTGWIDGVRVGVPSASNVQATALVSAPPPPLPPRSSGASSDSSKGPPVAIIAGAAGGGGGGALLLIIAIAFYTRHRRAKRRAEEEEEEVAAAAAAAAKYQQAPPLKDVYMKVTVDGASTVSGSTTDDGGFFAKLGFSVPSALSPSSPLTSIVALRDEWLATKLLQRPSSSSVVTVSVATSSGPATPPPSKASEPDVPVLRWSNLLPSSWEEPQKIAIMMEAEENGIQVLSGNPDAEGDETVVYALKHRETPVAIKRLSLLSPQTLACFAREVQALGSMRHPYIITMYCYSADERFGYIVLELATEGCLRDWLMPVVTMTWIAEADGQASKAPAPPTITTVSWLLMKDAVGRVLRDQGHIGNFSSFQFKSLRATPHPPALSTPTSAADGTLAFLEVAVGTHMVTLPIPESASGLGEELVHLLQTALSRLPCLTALDRLSIAYQTMTAVTYLHKGGDEGAFQTLHHDIKAGNVLLSAGRIARLADFGISRLRMEGAVETAHRGGTVGYMDPRLQFEGVVGPTNDIYSFGRLLGELFDRRVPPVSTDSTVPSRCPTADEETAAVEELSRQVWDVCSRLSALCLESDLNIRPDTDAVHKVLAEWMKQAEGLIFSRSVDAVTASGDLPSSTSFIAHPRFRLPI